ncbi:hypothetical protein Syn8016DRAFT_1969 [Synechococcus sp. WH 8016]|nr:hypothetical protein Syn8016DRAFT_1969 [Synechococcus sp. WH 8016]
MTALPTIANNSPISCGVGSGGYSNRYAMSLGCAIKTSERVSFNVGGSYVFGGSSDYGNSELSNYAGRAGFVISFGNIQSSSDSNLKSRVKALEKEKKSLILRLERLEALASGIQSNHLASMNQVLE